MATNEAFCFETQMKLINLSGCHAKASMGISDGKVLFVHFLGGNVSILGNVSKNGYISISIFGKVSKNGYVSEMTTVCPTDIENVRMGHK